jgi:hypothetical protein
LEFTGLTRTDAVNKQTEIEGDIAKSLGVSPHDVTIISITEVEVRRRRRLLAKKLVIVYEVKVQDEAAATALKNTMTSTTFKESIETNVESTTGVPVTVTATEPVVADTAATKAPAAGSLSSSGRQKSNTVKEPNKVSSSNHQLIVFVLVGVIICLCGIVTCCCCFFIYDKFVKKKKNADVIQRNQPQQKVIEIRNIPNPMATSNIDSDNRSDTEQAIAHHSVLI